MTLRADIGIGTRPDIGKWQRDIARKDFMRSESPRDTVYIDKKRREGPKLSNA